VIQTAGSFFFLLAHEVRLAFRWRRDSQRWGRLAVFAIMAALLLGFGWMGANLLAAVSPDLSTPTLAGVSVAIGFIATLMLGHALIAATEAVYTRGDLDLLLSSPVSAITVLSVRALGVAVRVATVYVALAAGMLVSLAILGAWRWLSIGPALIGLSLLTTAFGLILAMILFATIGPRATRVVAQVLGAFIGASLVLAFQLPNILRSGSRASAYEEMFRRLSTLDWPPTHPLLLPARAFLGDTHALLAWSASCALTFLVATIWFSRRFMTDAAAVLSIAPKRRAPTTRVRPFRGGVTLALALKEWRLLVRDPVLLSQIMLQFVWMIPLVLLWMRNVERGEVSSGFLGLMGAAVTAISASLAGTLAWVTVSAEDAPDLIAAAPVERARVDFGKLIAAAFPVVVLAGLAAAFVAQKSLVAGLWTLAGAATTSISAGLIGIWHQEPGSRKDFRRRPRASWTAQLGQSFVGLGWAGATGFAAGGNPVLAIIPAIVALGLLLALGESRRTPA
jgi:ABC-2 type transport system permease protein